jgi:hypothetical protein
MEMLGLNVDGSFRERSPEAVFSTMPEGTR